MSAADPRELVARFRAKAWHYKEKAAHYVFWKYGDGFVSEARVAERAWNDAADEVESWIRAIPATPEPDLDEEGRAALREDYRNPPKATPELRRLLALEEPSIPEGKDNG